MRIVQQLQDILNRPASAAQAAADKICRRGVDPANNTTAFWGSRLSKQKHSAILIYKQTSSDTRVLMVD